MAKVGSKHFIGIEDEAFEVRLDNVVVLRADTTVFSGTMGVRAEGGAFVPDDPIMSASVSVLIQSASLANRDIGLTEHFTLVDAGAGAVKVFLPPAATAIGRTYVVKKLDASANAVTVSSSAAAEVEGQVASVITGRSGSFSYMSDGTHWHIVAGFSGSSTV